MYINLTGERNIKLYIYDGRPLKNVHMGDRITFDLTTEPMILTSILNGSVVDTHEREATVALYQGKPVGVLFWGYDALSMFAQYGIYFRITGVMTGMYKKGIPDFELNLPTSWELNIYADECRYYGGIFPYEDFLENPPIEVHVSGSVWHDPRNADEYDLINPSLELIPIPGTKRVPLIAIKDGEITVAEVPGRNPAYQDLKSLLNRSFARVSVARRIANEPDKHYYYYVTFYFPRNVQPFKTIEPLRPTEQHQLDGIQHTRQQSQAQHYAKNKKPSVFQQFIDRFKS